MGRDYPDWGGRSNSQIPYLVHDLAELAARLYSPASYERAGRVLWMTEFEAGLGEFTAQENDTGDVSLTTTQVYSGGFAARLASGAGATGVAAIWRYDIDFPDTLIGFSFIARLADVEGELRILLAHQVNGTGYYLTTIRYLPTGDILQILDDEDNWQTLRNTGALPTSVNIPVFFKVVMDLRDHTNVRLMFNSIYYNLLDYAPVYTEISDLSRAVFSIQARAAGEAPLTAIIDRVIYTVDEPNN